MKLCLKVIVLNSTRETLTLKKWLRIIMKNIRHEEMFVSSDPPSAPRWLEVINISRNSAELKWTVPERDGGSPITNYVVEKRDVRRKGWQTVDTTVKELKYTVTPLNEGSLYVFRVAAENAVGLGPFCELPDSVLAKDTFSEFNTRLSHKQFILISRR